MPSNPDSVSALLDHSEALYFSGKLREAIALLERALGSASVKDFISVELQLGKLLVAAIFMEGANPQPARVHLQGALTGGDPRQRATATDLLGLSCYYEQLGRERPEYTLARRHFETALAARKVWGTLRELSESEFHLGIVDQFTGHSEEAMNRFRRAYALATEGDHRVEQSFAIRHIGFLQRARGDFMAAYESMAESLLLRQQIGMVIYLPFSHLSLAEVAFALERSEDAERNYLQAKTIAMEIGNKRGLLLAELGLGRLHRKLERWADARVSFGNAHKIAEEIGHRVALGEANDGLKGLPA
jgi:tetratricopeptide (TPR) repeat protein